MAQSYNYYVGNGVKTDYEFTRELNTQATVVGFADLTLQSGTWDSVTGFFTFDVAPAAGAGIYIARSTANDTAVATYPNKSYINSENLDADFRQSLMQVQELQLDIDMAKLLNEGAPGYAAAAAQSAADAASSAAAALVSENNADTSETNSLASELKAGKWATEAWNVEVETGLYSAKHWATEAMLTLTGLAKSDITDFVESDYVHTSGPETIAGIKTFVNRVQVGHTFATTYNLSVQNNSSSTWIEMLNNVGANKGVFFGLSTNDFQQWNYQGGDISFFTAPTAGSGSLRFNIAKDGVITAYGNIVSGVSAPTLDTHLTRKDYVDTADALKQNLNLTLNAQTGTTYTFVLTDNGKYVRGTNAAAQTYTIPLNASVAYPVGAQIHLRQAGAGQITVAATAGVTINTSETLLLRKQHSTATIMKVGTDEWDITGDMEAA